MVRINIEVLGIGLFAFQNFQDLGTPLIFSRRGDGGEVFAENGLTFSHIFFR